MKTGIIIIFHNYERFIDKELFVRHAEKAKYIHFCLVNNNSKDNTYRVLKDIKEVCQNVSVVNIKKFKPDISAVKAGARYMFNQFDLDHLGYINTNLLNKKNENLNTIIKVIEENKEDILKYDIEIVKKNEIKQSLYQNLFSVIDYLKKLKLEWRTYTFDYKSKL